METEIYRIIDANLNRIAEGLRVLEEVARLALNNPELSKELKDIRHDILTLDSAFQKRLIQARDAANDVGAGMESSSGERDLPATIVANSRRVQEGLRVIEEMAKLQTLALDGEKFKKARFALYDIEKSLLSKVMRRDKMAAFSGLYIILDGRAIKGCRYIEAAYGAISSGAKIIELSDETTTKAVLLPLSRRLKELCVEKNVLFIIKSHFDLVLIAEADGLSLGSKDLPVNLMRRSMPIDKILGSMASTVEQAVSAQSGGADYIIVGPMFSDYSGQEAIGLEKLHEIRQVVSVPVVAFGDINEENIEKILSAGADTVAVIPNFIEERSISALATKIESKLRG